MSLRAPFPWFGGKRRVASLVWRRLGDVDTYNEPFAGSLAVLLGRPHEPRVETVNDKDAHLANFWRALQHDPDGVAAHCDWPVNEADLHARHRWLVSTATERAERVMCDPDFYDVKVAGWWVWGQCLWIGSGWCSRPEWTGRVNAGRRAKGVQALEAKRPAASRSGTSVGIHRPSIQTQARWQGGGNGGGSGVHAPTLSRQLPQLSGDAGTAGRGVASDGLVKSDGLYEYMRSLSLRLRRVRVCCGDWRRVLTPSVTTYIGLCGVFLDPPYAHKAIAGGANKVDGQAPSGALCNYHDADVSADVRAWAIEHGDDPNMRIALCGYEGEHDMPDSWECVAWKAHGGYSRTERGIANRERERIWFSPHCLKAELPLFREEATA